MNGANQPANKAIFLGFTFKFKELKNTGAMPGALYVLQSSNDTQYDDHINCVNDADELAEQANLIDVMYAGEKLLPNGMIRFMVIGR